MKNKVYVLMSFLALFTFTACSSNEFDIKETDVPPNVIGAFRAKYPSAQVVKWVAEKEGGKFYFGAKIKDGDKEREVHIAPDGSSVSGDD